jgi:hypothetical protein
MATSVSRGCRAVSNLNSPSNDNRFSVFSAVAYNRAEANTLSDKEGFAGDAPEEEMSGFGGAPQEAKARTRTTGNVYGCMMAAEVGAQSTPPH